MKATVVTCLLLHLISRGLDGREVRVGVLIPITGSFRVKRGITPAIRAAFAEINKQENLLGNILTYSIKDSGCNKTKAVGIAADLMTQPTVDAYIGPGCSVACLSAGMLAHYWNKPMVSYSCSSSDLEDRNTYSTFVRTQPFSRTYSKSTPTIMRILMKDYRWQRAAILATDSDVWRPMAVSLNNYFQANGIEILYFKIYDEKEDQNYAVNMMNEVMDKASSEYRHLHADVT